MNRVLAAVVSSVVSFFSALGVAFAAIDANTASPSELESISGIGPATSGRIVEERRRQPFRDTQDLMRRVKGIGEAKLRKMVAAGLTVGGNPALITAGGGQPSASRGEVIEIGACADRGPPADRPKQGDRAAAARGARPAVGVSGDARAR